MSKLTLKTDGKGLQDLRALYERQLDALRAAKVRESAKRAESEEASAAHKSALSDWMKSVSRTNHEFSPELEAADAAAKRTRDALEVAEVESKSLADAAAMTAVAIVAQTVGYRAALDEAREQIAELDRKRAEAIERYKASTSCLRGIADVSKR